MKRKSRTCHVTITVSKSLRQKMKETNGINFSRVASLAIASAIEAKTKTKSKNKTVLHSKGKSKKAVLCFKGEEYELEQIGNKVRGLTKEEYEEMDETDREKASGYKTNRTGKSR